MSPDDDQDLPLASHAQLPTASEACEHDAQTVETQIDFELDQVQGSNASALGALQMPSQQALERAKPIFEQLLEKARQPQKKLASSTQQVQAPFNAGNARVQTRQYPIASKYLLPHREPHADAGANHVSSLPARPPQGHAFVRASPPKASQKAAVISQGLLEKTTETALMWTTDETAQATTSFRLQFHDDILKDTTCLLTLHQGKLVATFYATDVDMRRLLEGQAARLESQLNQRGLRQVLIRIVQGDAPLPFETPLDT